MRKALATFAVIALLFVVAGCPGASKVKDLQAQVAAQQQQITDMQGQVQKLTMERDSLAKVITDMAAKTTGGKTTGGKTTGGKQTGKPPRTGQ